MVAARGITFAFFNIIFLLFVLPGIVVGLVFLIRGRKRKKASHGETEQPQTHTLGENIRENRIRSRMTQEFVAEQLGVSRQAVSKWENGTSEPSTGNLLALAKLFGMGVEELLK